MNHNFESYLMAQFVPILSEALSADIEAHKRGRPKRHHGIVKLLGCDQVSYLALKSCVGKLAVTPESTQASLSSEVARMVDLEYRMKESNLDYLGAHKRDGLKHWHKVKILKETTKGADKDTLLTLGLVCTSLMPALLPDVFGVSVTWSGNKMIKRYSLAPSVVTRLLEDTNVSPVVYKAAPLGSYTDIEFREGRSGGYTLDVRGGSCEAFDWVRPCTEWSISPDFVTGLTDTLRNGSGLFGELPEATAPEGMSHMESMRWYRQSSSDRSHWFAMRMASQELKGLSSGVQWPPSMDFRGRLYLQGYSSPHTLKIIRPYLLSGDETLTYYDMRTSNVTLIRLLLGLPIHEDLYDCLAGLAVPQWSYLLEDTYGIPTRDLMKEWMKGVFFGERFIASVDRVTKVAVHHGTQCSDLHQEVMRILRYLWDEANKRVPSSPFVVPSSTDPRQPLVCPDGWVVPLGYRRPKARRIKTRLLGSVPSMLYHEYIEGSVDTPRMRRALTANIVHSLEAFILRQQLRHVDHQVLPIHDCLGLPSGANKEVLARILTNTVDNFRDSLIEQGFLHYGGSKTETHSFNELYKKETQ